MIKEKNESIKFVGAMVLVGCTIRTFMEVPLFLLTVAEPKRFEKKNVTKILEFGLRTVRRPSRTIPWRSEKLARQIRSRTRDLEWYPFRSVSYNWVLYGSASGSKRAWHYRYLRKGESL
jgi:hypothetical protein